MHPELDDYCILVESNRLDELAEVSRSFHTYSCP